MEEDGKPQDCAFGFGVMMLDRISGIRLQRMEGDETEISMRGETRNEKNLTEISRKVSRMPRQQSNRGKAIGFSVVQTRKTELSRLIKRK